MAIEKAYGAAVTLARLRAVVAVAEAGSFSGAALELDVSQASVSYAVAQAENALGLKLFRRGAFGARLTEDGERIRTHAVRLLRAEEALLQEAQSIRGTLEGVVRVAAFPSIARYLLPGAMKRLREAHPSLALQPVDDAGSSAEVLDALEAGRAELGLVVAHLSETFIYWKLFDDPFVVCVPETLRRDGLTWDDLRDVPLIAYDKDWRDSCVSGMRYFLDKYMLPEPAYRVRETGVILGMIAQELGFSILPELALGVVPDGVARVRLEVPCTRTVSLAVPPELLRAPAVRAVLPVLGSCLPDSDVPLLEP